ncbi:hypothetical protein PP768_gp03 [Escherichia phage vB_EcoP-ZQ2]|uniref:Uncharacterized protein n=1 Tax=Escherichia phage vB_EcoP-ZQ2 TaxID=2810370 RepID=A0A8F3C7G0_9CAUD|nr:hypothetical protein PP768_gp03 [Escherichia phage vB_EcoP-ZQ2]QWY13138.1 hypothetical protein [Escherichia phage vB_EcoP-ZQ2]
MTYEELWSAQVRARALTRHDIYCALQNELKIRTKLGHISGLVKIPMRSQVWPFQRKGNEFKGNGLYVRIDYLDHENSIRIAFWTKR